VATATYRVGPSDFFTPGDLASDASTLNDQVTALDAQVEGNDQIDSTALDQWTAFLGTWKAFYASEFGGFFTNLFTALNDANRDQLIQYETTFGNFATQFASAGAQLAGGVVAPSSGSKDTLGAQAAAQTAGLPSLSSNKIIVIVALLIVLVFFLKKK
jgi:hypothetical protein